jgi:hypothetical protein
VKKNKEPKNVEIARQINLRKNKADKYKWVPCIVCGDLCPQGQPGFEDCDEVHVTCKYEPGYSALAKKLLKQKAEALNTSLF